VRNGAAITSPASAAPIHISPRRKPACAFAHNIASALISATCGHGGGRGSANRQRKRTRLAAIETRSGRSWTRR
jgi:hypothetical protein